MQSRRVSDALELVKLPHVRDRYPKQLSGGQQQRIALARAIVIEPAVLLLDEPLSALDANLREEMRVELKRIQHRIGVTTVFVTHDQSEALAMSDRVVVMSEGRVEQTGAPEEVYNTPASEFVANFLGASNILNVRVEALGEEKVKFDTDGLGSIEVAKERAPKITEPGRAKLVVRAEKLYIARPDSPADGMISSPGIRRCSRLSGSVGSLFRDGGRQKAASNQHDR